MEYFKPNSAYGETWFDEQMEFIRWATKKGSELYYQWYKELGSRPRGQMIIPQDSPDWHISNAYPTFAAAYEAYLEEKGLSKNG